MGVIVFMHNGLFNNSNNDKLHYSYSEINRAGGAKGRKTHGEKKK